MDEKPTGIVLTEEQKRRRRARSIAIALALGALVRAVLRRHAGEGTGGVEPSVVMATSRCDERFHLRKPRAAAAISRSRPPAARSSAAMVGMAFAAVPLYNWFCRTTGFAGTPQVASRRARPGARSQDHGALRRQCDRRAAVAVRAGAEFDRRSGSARSSPSTTRSSTSRRARPWASPPTTSRRRRSAPISPRSTASASPSSGSSRARSATCRWCSSSIPRSRRTPSRTVSTPSRCPTPCIRCASRRAPRAESATGTRTELTRYGEAARPLAPIERRRRATMADAHAKPHHDYHLVDPSPWPAVGAVSAFMHGGRRHHLDAPHVRRGAASSSASA